MELIAAVAQIAMVNVMSANHFTFDTILGRLHLLFLLKWLHFQIDVVFSTVVHQTVRGCDLAENQVVIAADPEERKCVEQNRRNPQIFLIDDVFLLTKNLQSLGQLGLK